MGGAAEDRDGGGRVVSDTTPRDSGARELAPQEPSADQLDVFISYTGNDWGWASWLDFVLREAGYSTVLQGYDFVVGKSFVEAMDDALRRARLVVCLFSPTYLASRWCREEWRAGLYQEHLFPIRIAECTPDGLLGPRAYLDVASLDEGEAQSRILAELEKRRGKDPRPKTRPGFPGSPKPAPAERVRFPGTLPPTWSIPEERNHHFTGRDDLLEQLRTALTQRKTGAVTQAVRGLGGVGKTQLALEYAYRFASEYEGVWWLHAEDPLTLARDYVDLAPELGVDAGKDQRETIRLVQRELRQRQRFLLVFDNATEPKTLRPYLPVGQANHVIITTRAHTWQGSRAVEVHEFALDVAIKFLLDRTGQDDRDAAQKIANRLGCLPLALEQAAAYVEECEIGLAEYASLLERGLEVLEQGAPHQYEHTVGTTWDLAFEQLRKRCPAAADLLKLCAFFGPEAIHLSELAKAKEELPESLAKLFSDDIALNEARAHLLSFSLIRVEGSAISIHRLVQEVTRQSLVSNGPKRWLSTALGLFTGRRSGQDERQQWLSAALRVLNGLVPGDSHDVRTWPECARWIPHALTAANRDGAEDLEPGACSRILNQAAGYHWARADYEAAEPMFRRALAIDESSLGPEHPDVSTCLNNLANLLRDTNRHDEAEPLSRRALAIWEASLSPDHPQVAIGLNNLATLLRDTNRLDEAEPLFRRTLAIHEENLGPNHPHVAVGLNNLAVLLKATNHHSEAEPLYRRALNVWEASLGPDHPQVATGLNNLAGLLRATNRLDEAEPLYRRALAISEASLGPDHPDVAICLNNLATLLRDTNRPDEAEPLFRRAIAIGEASLGPDHPDVATRLNNLALLLSATNRMGEAEPLYRRAVRIFETSLGDDHPRTVKARNNLAKLLEQRAAEQG